MPTDYTFRTPVAAVVSALSLLVALVTVAGSGQAAAAAAPDVRLASVACTSDPEVVEVKNFGDEGQDLTGWQMQSEGDAPFVLTPFGTIPAGGSIFIESGANAQGTFRWSQFEILRDNDPSDYVRLVDNLGATRGEIACAQAVATPTPMPSPTASAGGVPNGGGPPGQKTALLSPTDLIYAGGSMMGAVVGLAAAWLGVNMGFGHFRRRRSAAAANETAGHVRNTQAALLPSAKVSTAAPGTARAWRQPDTATQPLLLALVVSLGAAILVALMLQSQDSAQRR